MIKIFSKLKRGATLLLLLSFGLLASEISSAQGNEVPVFVSGQEGYKSFRIPAIVSMPNGKLLAFAEGRVHHAGDFGDVKIVVKTSNENGRTWSKVQIVADYDTLQAGNPAPVVDLTDPAYPKGRVFLFYNTGNNHEYDVRKGKGWREVWYKTSTDGGETWSDPVNITTQVHRPKQPSVNPAYNFSEDWRTYANTPGHALQFAWGKYKGRIYVAANHSAGDPQPNGKDYRAHGFYTDDHGKTFHISQTVDLEGGNENMAAQLSGNGLMLNLRNQQGHVKARYIALSKDGGETWYKQYFDKKLPDPVCQGSILNVGKKTLAFCNDADTNKRNNLTLRISKDDGKTWTKRFLIYSNDKINDASAYSDIVNINKNTIGVLYEKDGYSKIVFTTVKWK